MLVLLDKCEIESVYVCLIFEIERMIWWEKEERERERLHTDYNIFLMLTREDLVIATKNWCILWIRFWNLKGIIFLFFFFGNEIWKDDILATPTVVAIFLKIINDILVNGPLIHILWCRWTQQHSCIYTTTRDSLVVINAKTWESHD